MELARSDSFGRQDCVSVGLMAVNCFHGLNHSIESISSQSECLEIYVLCPCKLSNNVFEKCRPRFADPRINSERQDQESYTDFVNASSELFRGAVFAFCGREAGGIYRCWEVISKNFILSSDL